MGWFRLWAIRNPPRAARADWLFRLLLRRCFTHQRITDRGRFLARVIVDSHAGIGVIGLAPVGAIVDRHGGNRISGWRRSDGVLVAALFTACEVAFDQARGGRPFGAAGWRSKFLQRCRITV